MGTHDEVAKKFFKHSSVICVLAPRFPSSKLSIFKQQVQRIIGLICDFCIRNFFLFLMVIFDISPGRRNSVLAPPEVRFGGHAGF